MTSSRQCKQQRLIQQASRGGYAKKVPAPVAVCLLCSTALLVCAAVPLDNPVMMFRQHRSQQTCACCWTSTSTCEPCCLTAASALTVSECSYDTDNHGVLEVSERMAVDRCNSISIAPLSYSSYNVDFR